MSSYKTDKLYLKQYWQYLKRYRLQLTLALVMIPMITIFHLLQPWFIKQGIDDNIVKGDLKGLLLTSLFFGTCVVFEFIFKSVQGYLFQYIGLSTVTSIRADLFKHVMGFSSGYFDKTPIGVTSTRLTSDMESLNDSFASGLVTLIGDILTLIGIVVMMFLLSPKLTWVTLIVVPPLVVLVNFFRIQLRKAFNLIRTTIGQINGFLQEQLQGVEIVQLFNREAKNYSQAKALNKQYRQATITSVVYDAMLYSFIESLSVIVICIVIWYGWGRQFTDQAITIGILVAFVDYIQKFFTPLKEISNKFAVLQHALAALEKIFGLFNIHDHIESGTARLSEVKGQLSFKNVSYSYPGHEDKAVLHDVSFDINPGDVVAIVGPTGSGKTTISRLVTRLYGGYSGTIELDGVEIKELELHQLRKSVAIVSQDITIFSNTVAFNIGLGQSDITQDDMVKAAKAVQIHSYIMSLEKGYDTVISSRSLSHGQAQLISFARAMASKAPIVMLDEATASVDSLSEQKLQLAVEALLKKKTVLVIAHRLSTIKKASVILALKDGAVIESGSHSELIERHGFYSKLYQLQFYSES